MKNRIIYVILSLSLLFCFIMESFRQDADMVSNNWTHFRGSNLDGISGNVNLPFSWGEDTNISWKTPIHGKGYSSPVVFNQQVWITTATTDGKELYAVCLNRDKGNIIHDIKLFTPDSVPSIHALNTYATPTPAIEEGFVYIHFGELGTACLDTKTGNVIWKRTDLHCNHVQGPASCPIIYKDLLILHYEGIDIQYLIALDKKTGKTVWKSIRPQEYYVKADPIARKSYVTPIIINLKGKDLLISNGSEVCVAYDPLTGKEVWRVVYSSDSTIGMPLFSDGLVIFTTGFGQPVRLFAVNPLGTGDITNTNMVWQTDKDVPGINSPVVKDGLIYMIQERGTITCLEAKTGNVIWKNKLKGEFYSSPIIGDGKIYFPSKQGFVYVLKEGKEFNILAVNKLNGEFWTTMAVSGNSLILRTDKALYCIDKK